MNEKLLSTSEVAEFLGLSVATIYRLANKRDGLKGFKLGGALRFRPSDVEAFLAASAIKPPERHTPLPGMKRFQYKPGMRVVSL